MAYLEAECRRLKKSGVTDKAVIKMEEEIHGLSKMMETVIAEAAEWGFNDLDWESATVD